MEIIMSTESKVREVLENILEEKEYEAHYRAVHLEKEVKITKVELDDGEFLIIEG
jgi:hypothetical protein